MIGLKRLPMLLLVAASLVGACGDDKKDNGDDGEEMPGDGDGDGDASTPPGSCDATGIFAGATAEEVHAIAMTKNKACASMADAEQACSVNVSAAAGTAGRSCFGLGEGAEFDMCVLDGTDSIQGINDAAPNLADGCATCFLEAVKCSREHCMFDCINPATVEACDTCRAMAGCITAFFECSGFPTAAELDG
jgi:hypothetical protein